MGLIILFFLLFEVDFLNGTIPTEIALLESLTYLHLLGKSHDLTRRTPL